MSTAVNTTVTVGELVAQKPARARVFEKIGIDYCCGGKKPLEQACSEKGLDPRTVAVMLDAADAPAAGRYADAQSMTLSQLCDHIERTHHDYLRRELPRVAQLLQKVINAHGARHPEMIEVGRVYAEFSAELSSHMMKEERVLFPAIREMENSGAPFHCGSIANPIRQMEAEHDSAGDALARFRELTSDYTPPADACNTFRALLDSLEDIEKDMHQHVHKENNVLFPRAIEQERRMCTSVNA